MSLLSGVPGFDALVEGGFPKGTAIVVQGPAGREKDAFLFQFITEGLRSGGCALVVLSSLSPAKYQQQLREAGVDVDKAVAENRLKFVDWFTHKESPVQDVEQDGPVFRASIDLANVGIAIARATVSLSKDGERRAAVEILSPALSAYDLSAVYSFAQSMKAKLERSSFTSLFVLEKEMHDERAVSSIHQPFDGVVDIERTRDGDRLVRKVAVLSLKGTAAESKYVPIEVGKDRVIRVFADPARQLSLLHQAELIKSNPDDPKLWLPTARNLRAMGDIEQALRCVEGALKLDPHLLEAWGLKAEFLEALGRHQEAEEARARATPPPPAPPKKLDHAARLVAFAEQRLRNDPHDPDALFVTAAARARDKDLGEAAAILEKLAEVDDTYPGLWVLKTMLHAKRGELDKARESRERRLEVEARLDHMDQEATRSRVEPEPSRFCGSCRSALLDEETVCPRCGARIEGPRELPPPPFEPPTEPSAVRPPRPSPRPDLPFRPEPAPRGLTNGLGKETPRGTGRTNGLVNGTRTNGMTNGLAGGPVSLRTGMTNGLTNGSGFTNGLGSARYRREAAGRRWKLYLIPILSAMLLTAPLLAPTEGGRYPIAIDGDFSDWTGVSLLATSPVGTVPPNIDLVRFGVSDNVEYLAFYFEVAGTALAGGGSPPIMDTFRAFLDVDRDSDTGYLVAGLGADRLVEVSGSGGRVQHAQLSEWDAARDPLDWSGWIKSTFMSAAAQGPRVEAHVVWLALVAEKRAIDVAFHAMAYDGAVDMGEYVASTTAGSLLVAETVVVPQTVSGTMVPLVQFDLAAAVRDVTYDSLTVTLTGTAPVSAISELHLVDELGSDLGVRVPLTQEITFQFPPRTLRTGETEELTLVASTTSTSGDTLGARIDSPGDIGAGPAAVSIVRVPVNRAVGYLGMIPAQAVVDGGFSEWTNTTSDAVGEPGVPARIDLVEYSFYLNTVKASMYFRVSGQALAGAVVPALPAPAPEGGVAPLADADRDRVPDAADAFPFDFNNDGVADVATAGDADADSVVDYPAGPDQFLNTTIPGTFPAPYAGQDVSVYIGPINRPVVLGEDVARVLIDADDDSVTGFRVDAIGADYLVEIRGKHGVMTTRTLSAYGGAGPWDWTWTPLETVAAASAFGRVEFSFDALGRNLANDSRAYFEVADWSGARDNGGQATIRLGTRAGVSPQLLDISGNQKHWLRDTDHASETACTAGNNKVASTAQGSAPVNTITLSTTQSACWYLDTTTGTTVAAGDWESLLDITLSSTYSAKVGAFNIGTGGAGTTVPVAGVGFQPKAVQFWWSGRTSSTDSAGSAAHQRGFGVAVSTTDRRAVCSADEDGVAPGSYDAASMHRADEAICSVTTGGSVDGLADLSSMDASGFTLIIDAPFSASLRIHYLALGGSSLTNVVTGTFTESGAIGNQDVTTVGFQPDAVVLFSAMIGADPPGSALDSDMMVGFAAGSGNPNDVVWAGGGEDSPGTVQTISYHRATESLALFNAGVTATDGRAEVDAWLSNGFSLEWAARAGARRIHYLALKGGSYVVGDLLTLTSSGTIAESGFGFSPKASLFLSHNKAQSTAGAVQAHDELSVGAFSSTADRGAQCVVDVDAANPSNVGTAVEHDEVYCNLSTAATPAIEGLMGIQTVDSDGFTLFMDDSDPVASFVGYIAFGADVDYGVYLDIWDMTADSVRAPIGSCLGLTMSSDDVQCLISGAAAQTIASNEVVRIRVVHSGTAGTVSIDYDDADLTGDSRVTIPVPEFEEVALPVLATVLVPLVWRWSHRRRSRRARGAAG